MDEIGMIVLTIIGTGIILFFVTYMQELEPLQDQTCIDHGYSKAVNTMSTSFRCIGYEMLTDGSTIKVKSVGKYSLSQEDKDEMFEVESNDT